MAKTTKESVRAKEACEQYLLLGPDRSLAKLAESMGKRPGYVQVLKAWSSALQWQEKAKEYDKEQAAARRREIDEARREMDKEHALWGHEQALRAMKIIEEINAAKKFTSQAAVQLFKTATDLQRIAMGSATEQIALTGKDGGAMEMDIIIETFWGRGTDPRRKVTETTETVEEDPGDDDEEDDEGLASISPMMMSRKLAVLPSRLPRRTVQVHGNAAPALLHFDCYTASGIALPQKESRGDTNE